MTLKDFLKTLTSEEREAFAKRVGSSKGHLANVAYGDRYCSGKLAVAIEKETNGIVRADETAPDVDWDYIRGSSRKLRLQRSTA